MAVQVRLLGAAGGVVPADPGQPAGLLVDPDRLPGQRLAVIPRPHVRGLALDVGHRRGHPGAVRRDHVRRLRGAAGQQQPGPVHAHRLDRGEHQVVVGHGLTRVGVDLVPDLRAAFLGGIGFGGQRLRFAFRPGPERPRPAAQRHRPVLRIDAGWGAPAGRTPPAPAPRWPRRPTGCPASTGPHRTTPRPAPSPPRPTGNSPHPTGGPPHAPESAARGRVRTLLGTRRRVLMRGAVRPPQQVLHRPRGDRCDREHATTVP